MNPNHELPPPVSDQSGCERACQMQRTSVHSIDVAVLIVGPTRRGDSDQAMAGTMAP